SAPRFRDMRPIVPPPGHLRSLLRRPPRHEVGAELHSARSVRALRHGQSAVFSSVRARIRGAIRYARGIRVTSGSRDPWKTPGELSEAVILREPEATEESPGASELVAGGFFGSRSSPQNDRHCSFLTSAPSASALGMSAERSLRPKLHHLAEPVTRV